MKKIKQQSSILALNQQEIKRVNGGQSCVINMMISVSIALYIAIAVGYQLRYCRDKHDMKLLRDFLGSTRL